MSTTVESQKLIARLERIRQIAYRRWVLYGVMAVASGGVYALLTILCLDWWLDLPSVPRLAIGLMFIVGFALAMTYWIYRPVRSGVGVSEIAARIERYFGDFSDRLSSLVSFARATETTSASMVRQFLVNTERIIAQRDLEKVLTARPLITSTAFLFVSVAILVSVALLSPQWLWTGLSRYLDPFGAVEWPRQVEIMALTRNLRTPISESARVRMRVSRGLHETLRGVVHITDAEGRSTTLAMSRNGDEFEAVVQPVLSDITYWFEAGDADTRREPGAVRVVHRPQIEQVQLTLHPPPYAKDSEPGVTTLSGEPVEVIRGSTAELAVRCSKPALRHGTPEALGLQMSDGRAIPLRPGSDDRRLLNASFEVSDDVQFRITLTDEEGYQNQGGALYTLLARQDAAPRVSLVQPTSALECTAQCVIGLAADVEDDFGVADIALESRLERSEDASVTPIPFERPARLARSRVGVSVAYDWELASLGVQPGDVVNFSVAATDNFPGTDGHGQVGRSPPLQLRIISDAEYERRAREQLYFLERQLRQTQIDQEEVLESLAALQGEAGGEAAWTAAQKDKAASAAARESRLARNLKDLARRMKTLAAQMQANRVEDRQWPPRVRQVGDKLASTAAEPMTAAVNALNEAREHLDAADRDQSMTAAAEQAAAALKNLQEALDEMSRWGDSQGLASRIKDFLERQEGVRNATAEVGKDAVGLPVDALKDNQRTALDQVARRQEQLNDDVEKALARLREQAAALPEDQRATRDTMEQAVREAASNELTRHMRDAAEAIRQNRTAAAGLSQKAAEDAMRRMSSGLREGQRRELDELRKSLERSEDMIAELLRRQEELQTTTHEAVSTAAPAEAIEGIAADQDQLRTNTRWAGEELSDTPRAADAARLVRQAVSPMGQASTALTQKHPSDALEPQTQAAALLREALDALSQLSQEVREELVRQTLGEIRAALKALAEAQRTVTGGIEELKTRVDQAGKIGRTEAKTASDLAREQAGLKEQVKQTQADLEDAPVFAWSLQRVGRWMEDAADRLSRRAVNDELVDLSKRTLHELETLLQSITDLEGLISEPKFAGEDAGGGGEGAQSSTPSKPIPTVTELLVLKAMQTDINQRTRALHDELEGVEPTETQLRRLRSLGEDQAELRRLTEKLVEQAGAE